MQLVFTSEISAGAFFQVQDQVNSYRMTEPRQLVWLLHALDQPHPYRNTAKHTFHMKPILDDE